jgi:non-structural maintenance of chromosomes element 1
MDSYTDANRAFLQAFLCRSTLTLESAKPIVAACSSFDDRRQISPQDVTVEDLNDYIAVANRRISPLDLEIRSILHQQTRERIYGLVNTTSDAFTQLATTYTADEMAFVKNLLDKMFEGQNNRGRREAMCVSGIEAIQVGQAPKQRRPVDVEDNAAAQAAGFLGGREVEAMLSKLVQEGWLEKSRAGFYSLSPRALMELRGWLVHTYNDDEEDEDGKKKEQIKFCRACKEIITVVRPGLLTWSGKKQLTASRANDARTASVLVGCTTSVLKTFFGCRKTRGVLCAGPSGMASTLLARKRSRPRRATRLASEEAGPTTNRD